MSSFTRGELRALGRAVGRVEQSAGLLAFLATESVALALAWIAWRSLAGLSSGGARGGFDWELVRNLGVLVALAELAGASWCHYRLDPVVVKLLEKIQRVRGGMGAFLWRRPAFEERLDRLPGEEGGSSRTGVRRLLPRERGALWHAFQRVRRRPLLGPLLWILQAAVLLLAAVIYSSAHPWAGEVASLPDPGGLAVVLVLLLLVAQLAGQFTCRHRLDRVLVKLLERLQGGRLVLDEDFRAARERLLAELAREPAEGRDAGGAER